MRTDKRWTTLEYCWRYGVRPLMWVVRIAVVFAGIAAVTLAIPHTGTNGMVAFIAIYGIWEIGRSIRSIQPLNINIARGEILTVENGASVSVPTRDLDRVIEAIARQEARKGDAA